jgi:hypothetical protein
MVDLATRTADTPASDPARDNNCLADYRDAVERLRGQTVDELGRQPMAPETASMLAVMAASLPIVAALHPANPLTLDVWQVGASLAAVWAGVFWQQRGRYNRFHAAWSRKVAEHGEVAAIPVQPYGCRRSGQTTGAWAAEKRFVSVSSSSAMARTSSSRPARTTSALIERPSSSQTSREPSIQRQGASL